jgi:hypothetical protein
MSNRMDKANSYRLLMGGLLLVSLTLAGCSAQKPYPLYHQTPIPELKAYQEQVNQTQNYVYRSKTFNPLNDQPKKEL